MGQQRRVGFVLQAVLLVSAILLEVAVNFAASDTQSSLVRVLARLAVPAVIVLMLVVIAGNIVVLRIERPRAGRPAWLGGRAPYPGLAAFTEQDAAVYFGRDAQVADLVRRLHSAQDEAAGRFVCVTGSSGAGKSSLIHAGVLPQLRERGWRVLPVVVPAGAPARRLAAAFAQRDPAAAAGVIQPGRAGSTDRGHALVQALSRGRSGRTLLVVDQLEELVTLSDARERDQFLSAIQDALTADPQLRVLAALRVEFLPDLLASAQPKLFGAPVALGGLGAAELVAAVEKPAELAGMLFESGLVARIVDDAAGRDALPCSPTCSKSCSWPREEAGLPPARRTRTLAAWPGRWRGRRTRCSRAWPRNTAPTLSWTRCCAWLAWTAASRPAARCRSAT